LTKEQLLALVDCDTDALYEEINAKAKQRGVLILTGHFGSFELFHSAMAAKGTPISLVHRATNNPYFDVYLDNVRQRFGTKTLVRGDAAREIVRELRSGGVVAIPFDQVAHAEIRVFAPFFGIDASTNSGLARLALRTGASVYPAFLVRTGTSLRHRAVFGPPVELVRTGDLTQDVLVNTSRFNEVLERFVREHPDHWIWMYRRWRKQPEGLCSPYLEGAPPLDAYRAATSKAHAGH
jgi:KDO2-lipid IV(A) lauroyltransferase